MPTSIDTTYVDQLIQLNIKLLESYKGAKTHHQMECMVCNHHWTATPISKVHNFKKWGKGGCPLCTAQDKKTNVSSNKDILVKQIEDLGYKIIDDGGFTYHANSYKNVFLLHRPACGHTFSSNPRNVARQQAVCPVCNAARKRIQFQQWNLEKQDKFFESADEWTKYKHKAYAITKKTYTKFKATINPLDLPRGVAGQEGTYHLDHIVPIRKCFDHGVPVDLCAAADNLAMLNWRQNVAFGSELKHIPASMSSYFKLSTQPTTIDTTNIVPDNILGAQVQYKKVNNIDIPCYFVTPDVVVVFCEFARFKEQNTTTKKFNVMVSQAFFGQRVVQIYQDEWQNKHSIVISKLESICRLSMDKTPIYARKCNVVVLPQAQSKIKNNFLDNNHIQGRDWSTITIGAYYNADLVAVMTFSKPRIAMNNVRGKDVNAIPWELCRFATDIRYRVVGLASKMLKYFTNTHNWSEIYTFADQRYSKGNMYEQLGFEAMGASPPSYFYIEGDKKKHRFNYRKDQLQSKLQKFDKNISEYQNCLASGIDRVWDCGSLKYRLVKKEAE